MTIKGHVFLHGFNNVRIKIHLLMVPITVGHATFEFEDFECGACVAQPNRIKPTTNNVAIMTKLKGVSI